MTSFRLESGRSGWMEFESRQREYREGVYALLTPELNPLASDEDLNFLRDKTVIAENVERLQGDRSDLKSTTHHLYRAIEDYKRLYGRHPGEDQLAAIGSALRTSGGGSSAEMISEAAQTVSADFTARPQFMTLAALLPLTTISAHLGYSVGMISADELAIHELMEEGEPDLKYKGELSSTCRIVEVEAEIDGTTETGTYFAELDYPIVPGRVRLIINGRLIAEDNGQGQFVLVGDGVINAEVSGDSTSNKVTLPNSEFDYNNSDSDKKTINVTFASALNRSDPSTDNYVHNIGFEVQVDVDNYSEFLPSIKFQTRSFTARPTVNVIHTGFSLKAVLRALRNMRLNLPEAIVPRLLRGMANDIDRQVIHRLLLYSRRSVEDPLLGYPPLDVSSALDFWTAELTGRLDYVSGLVLNRTGGTAQIESWVGGSHFRRMALYALASAVGRPAPPGEPAYPGQACYLGELEGQKLFFAPFLDDDQVLGTAGGALPSRFPVILGAAGPILPIYPHSGPDLGKHCSLYMENFQDTTPEARQYLESFEIKAADADTSLYDFAGRYDDY